MFLKWIRSFALVSSLVLLAACAGQTTSDPVGPAPAEPSAMPEPVGALDGWELVWQDEFDGPEINPENWTYDIGGGGWGNNEWQFYTDRPENARIEDGVLVIEAREEEHRGRNYTSARLKTQGLQTFTYGRIEASMQLPTGQGVWSAFWMLGEDITTRSWPASGEIDIMENIGQPSTTYGTIHGPGYSGGNGIGNPYSAPGVALNEGFHRYAVEWEPTEIRWYVDDDLFFKVASASVPGEWVYDHPFFILLNLAIGGNWPGYPDESTQFPQQFLIDYVRVYRDPDLNLADIQSDELRVTDIDMEISEVNGEQIASVYVTVVNQDGEPVQGAVVTAGWLGVITGADKTATTDENGIAGPFEAKDSPISKEISFCVTNITGQQFSYVAEQNLVTCQALEP